MGGFFGAASEHDCVTDVFFGTDYHSHLGTRRGGMTAFSPERGFQRAIHSIENSPFRTKFENDVVSMKGGLCIGCISDTDPQQILMRSKQGLFAVCSVGIIQNSRELMDELLQTGCASFEAMSSGNINSVTQSCHCYGTTFDLAYMRYDKVTRTHMYMHEDNLKLVLGQVLLNHQRANKIFVKYEAKQSCFHITVRQ